MLSFRPNWLYQILGRPVFSSETPYHLQEGQAYVLSGYNTQAGVLQTRYSGVQMGMFAQILFTVPPTL